MDGHFSVLGIARGASEAEMKKAFKSKALQYHPDRNPKGLETFKKVNAAYEALTAHYKKNGGVDKRSFMEDDAGGGGGGSGLSRGFSGRHWNTASSTASAPLFTEEELFGRMGSDNFGVFGGSSSSRGSAGGGGGAFSSRSMGGGFRQSKQPPPPTSSAQNDAANEAWRNAHGGRAPQSGYNAFKSDAESGAFKSQMKQFEEMERLKRAMGGGGAEASSSAASASGTAPPPPRFGRRSPSKYDTSNTEGSVPNYQNAASGSSSNTSGGESNGATRSGGNDNDYERPLPRQGSASTLLRAKRDAAAAASSAASSHNTSSSETPFPTYSASQNNIESQRELEAEWAAERERQTRLRRAQEEMEATERRLRREQLEAEVRMEWEKTQAEMELERTAREAEERINEINRKREEDEENGTVHYVDEGVRATALERRKERTEVLTRLLPSKPLLDKMTIQELYILRELTNEFQSKLFSMTESRIKNQTICLVCHATKKDPKTGAKFECGHVCICMTCSFTCAICPICGSDRTDM